MDNLIMGAIVDGNDQIEAGVVLGLICRIQQDLAGCFRKCRQITDQPDSEASLQEFLHIHFEQVCRQLHQIADFILGAFPVFG